MIDGWQIIQRKILASTRQMLLGNINVEGGCAPACRTDRKRAGVGKAIQQSSRRDMADVAAIFSLIEKEARGIARPRVQFCEKSLACQHSFERDEDVASETFHPAFLHRAEPVGVRSLCLKISK